MNACPGDEVLNRLIADVLPADQLQSIEAHLSSCSDCRRRLEDLNKVAALSHLLQQGPRAPTESARLRVVMDGLRADTAMLNGRCPTVAIPGQARGPLPQLQPTTKPGFIGKFGDIDIRRVIGRGGMGVVYEGFDTNLDRTVAVKMLSPHLLEDPDAKSRFLREAKSAAALSHESIVTIHAVTESGGMPALVLQYVPGESLADRIGREGKLPFEDVVRIGIQVARGLAAAHEHGLVHRDIKPGNILLGIKSELKDNGNRDSGFIPTVKIADFGLAKRVGNESITQEGILAGTPAYMSPEQASDGDVDARSDLFSLGVVLYHISSGKLPFPAESPFVLLDQIRNTPPRPLREANPDLPEWFTSIVHRLLEKKPIHRIGSATELAELLERQTAVTPVRHTRRGWMGASGIVGLLAIAGAAAYFWPSKQTENPPPLNGFVVDAATPPHATLADAVAAAGDNSVIEIHGNGPFATNTVRIEGKKLAIRAAAGFAPKFVPEFRGKGGATQFINSNSDLSVEGLEVEWPNAAMPFTGGKDEAVTRCVISSGQGQLRVARCRISCGELGICIGSNRSQFQIVDCQLSAPAMAACIGWRPSATDAATIRNCLFEGHIGLFIGQSDTAASAKTTIENCTFTNDRAIRFVLDSTPKQPMTVTVNRTIFDCPVVVSMLGLRSYSQTVALSTNVIDIAKKTMVWTESTNIYRKEIMYLSATKPNSPMQFVPTRLKRLDQWLEYWNLNESQSLEGGIRRDERGGLLAVDGFDGPVPKNIGVDAINVGPTASKRSPSPTPR